MMGNPPLLMPYQPFCDLHFHFYHQDDVSNYRRSLDLKDATATVSYQVGGVGFRREAFISHPDQVMVMHQPSDQPGQQNFSIAIDSPQPESVATTTGDDTLQLTGQIQPRQNPDGSWIASWTEPGLHYAALLRVQLAALSEPCPPLDPLTVLDNAYAICVLPPASAR